MSKPENVGLSSKRLATLDRVMKERYVDTALLPGWHTQIWRKGELAHNSMTGQMDLERNKGWREDAIVRIYSMTKPITAVALMMLVEEGPIGLDDAVHTYIPARKGLRVYQSGIPSLVENIAGRFSTSQCERPLNVVVPGT